MRLFWVIVLFGSNLLSAASVAVITEHNSSFSSSCSAGMTTLSPCPPGILGGSGGISGPDYQVNAYAGPSRFPPTSIPGASLVSAEADFELLYPCSAPFACPPFIPLSANAEASDEISGYTEGPSRLGSIQVSVGVAFEDYGPPSDFGFTDGTNVYDIGNAPPGSLTLCCGGGYDATFPFRLGGPFDVFTSASAGGSLSSCPVDSSICGAGNEEDAVVSFVLLEPDGSAIPFVSTPEPGPWALCTLSLVFAIPRVRRRRR